MYIRWKALESKFGQVGQIHIRSDCDGEQWIGADDLQLPVSWIDDAKAEV